MSCNCSSKKKLVPTIRKTKSVVKSPKTRSIKPTRRIRRITTN